ncbi:hypothetical protein J0H58_32520 [bacterium]|nr:hypothetical protein [bacterium]
MPRITIRQPNRRNEDVKKPMPHTFAAGGMVRRRIENQAIKTVKPVLNRSSEPGIDIDPIRVIILPDLFRARRFRWIAIFRNVTTSATPEAFELKVSPVTVGDVVLTGNQNTARKPIKVQRGGAITPTEDLPNFEYPPANYPIEEGEREYFMCFGGTDSVVSSVSLGNREADYKESVKDANGQYFFWWAEFTNLLSDPGAGSHDLEVGNDSGFAAPRPVIVED